ncbi:hypothetical protein L6273_02685 [Candidatus Parcubacteria bacterium]|nr:hypothetical protein [Candidatus Parcubacteria bacterium]
MHCSLAGACGPYQFMPGTWPSYSPWPGADRTAWPDAPNGASNMVAKLGLDKETTMLGHRGNFTGSDGSLCWNQHVPQADYVWRCTQAVREALGR